MTVKFIIRQQVVQIIEGENSRKGELAIVTHESDLDAHNVEKVVMGLANARANKTGNREDTGRVDSFIGRVQQGTS